MKQSQGDPYCYSGTNVLKNLLNLRDPHQLEMTESALTASQSLVVELSSKPPHDLAQLLHIHRTLFGKLYPFAGKLRQHTGTMAKVRASGYTVSYGDSAFVPEQIAFIFRRLAAEDYLIGLEQDAFAARAAHFYGELDAVHPFREGNSRTLRLFFSGLAHTAGYLLDWRILAARETGRNDLYAARDRAVMRADSVPLAALFATILFPR
jgi:cell filamentation protein